MKNAFILAAAVGLAAAGVLPAAAADPKDDRATVVFDHPEKFTDVKDSYIPTDKGRDAILKQIQDYIVRQTGFILGPGYHLTITFTDLDLAGDFEPWRGAQWDDIRVVKDIYPPRYKFSYSLTDASGKVVLQGDENYTDMAFQMEAVLDNQDPLRYEKAWLRSWLQRHLSKFKA
jgi:hypothetical protein